MLGGEGDCVSLCENFISSEIERVSCFVRIVPFFKNIQIESVGILRKCFNGNIYFAWF